MSDALRYPCGEPPALGCVREVADGVAWIRMPMPFALDHVNLWALREGTDGGDEPGSRWTLVDTGLQDGPTLEKWRQLLAGDPLLGGARIDRVLATHMHPDHIGLAGWLTRRFGCELWMTRAEYLNGRLLAASASLDAARDHVAFYRAAGWSDADLDAHRAGADSFGEAVREWPARYRRLRDGDELTIGGGVWRVVVGHGHSPEHACFYCPDKKLFVTGDQVLPRISTNVSVQPHEPEADPLGAWLESIDRFKRLVPDDVLVLPAHNEPFSGLHARLDRLAAGHHAGLERLRDRLRAPRRAVDVFGVLFRRAVSADARLLSLATGESLAHLNYLLQRGQATRTWRGGVAWYARSGAGA